MKEECLKYIHEIRGITACLDVMLGSESIDPYAVHAIGSVSDHLKRVLFDFENYIILDSESAMNIIEESML